MKRILPILLLLSLLCLPLLAGCSAEENHATRNAILSVLPDRDKGTITVKGELTADFLDGYRGNIYLFELPSHSGRTIDLRGVEPAASAHAASSVSFTVDLHDGMRSRLFSSFVLASYDSNTRQYGILTTAMAATELDPPSSGGAMSEVDLSVKGLSDGTAADALTLGASSALVEVSMGDIIRSDRAEDSIPYLWNGRTVYYDGTAISMLDETVSAYTAAGIRVYLQFVLRAPRASTPTCLYAPGATAAPADEYLPCMTDPEAAELLEGFFSFMVERYAVGTEAPGRGLCTDLLIGEKVNHVAQYAHDGRTELSLDDHIACYEQLVRLAHTALGSQTAEGRVFISLDDHWNGRGLTDGFGAQVYLSAFRDEAALRGDFDWHIAAGLYADSPQVWGNSEADVDRLTPTSFTRLLTDSLESYRTVAGELRRVVLTDLTIPGVNAAGESCEIDQAVSYAYAYTAAAVDTRVEALFYDAYSDRDGAAVGLYARTEDGGLRARNLCGLFTAMGTREAEAYLAVVRNRIGGAFTRLENSLIGRPYPLTILTAEATVRPLGESAPAEGLLRFDTRPSGGLSTDLSVKGDAALGGFVNTAGLEELALIHAGDTPVLRASLKGGEIGHSLGMTAILPGSGFAGGRQLSLDLLVHGGSANDTITVILTRDAKGKVEDGDGALCYRTTATLSSDEWVTLSCDIRDFAEKIGKEDEVRLTILSTGQGGEDTVLYLRGAGVSDLSGGSSFPTVWVVVAVAVAGVAVIGAVVFFLRWRKKRA